MIIPGWGAIAVQSTGMLVPDTGRSVVIRSELLTSLCEVLLDGL